MGALPMPIPEVQQHCDYKVHKEAVAAMLGVIPLYVPGAPSGGLRTFRKGLPSRELWMQMLVLH